MASGGDELVAQFERFCSLASSDKDRHNFTPKACGKLVADCWQSKYGKYDVKAITDASVFPACKDKGKQSMSVNKPNCEKFVLKCAHEIAKRKTKNTKIAENDSEVEAIKNDLIECLKHSDPHVKKVKQSTTGNVGGLTDTSKYTGAHKKRFDESGKGMGIDGREDRHKNTGYVQAYKDEGSYDKKK